MSKTFSSPGTIMITCANRITPYLRQELEALNFPIVKEEIMGIETAGTLNDCIKLNLNLRTANRVLFFLKKFPAKDPDELYTEIGKIEWEKYFNTEGYFSVVSYAENIHINNTTFASLRCKDAIVDRFDNLFGKRPNSGPDKNKTVVNLYWKNDFASIYLDTSGEAIAKHNYRKIPFKAPLNESLAAAIILASQWKIDTHFINPMCGSGTLAIEAAMMATNRVPGLLRSNYGFMHLEGFDKDLYEKYRAEARQQSIKKSNGKIIATDISRDAIDAAIKNATTAGVDWMIEFKVCDFKETDVPNGPGVVILNPEYGERLGNEVELEEVYKSIGDFFKQKCKGKMGFVFTGNMELAKKIGLKAKRRIELFNSQIDCRLLQYELYEGTQRVKKENQE